MEVYSVLKHDVRVPLVGNVPHSSQFIPDDLRKFILLNDDELKKELLLLTDHYVQEIFSSIIDAGGILVQYNCSRLILDPERFENDEKEEMSKIGMGVIYVKTSDGKNLRNKLDQSEREGLLKRFYRPYHRVIEQEISDLLKRFGRCLILDCHSFPSRPLPFEPDQNAERPDICVGTDEYHTPPSLIEAVINFFKRIPLNVSLNNPYAGTYVPITYLVAKEKRVSSIMIEINRKLYLNEITGEKLCSFEDVRNMVSRLVHSIFIPHLIINS